MAVAFEHYGQTVATAAPPQQARAPQPQPAAYVPPQASTAAAPQAAARHSDRLLRGSAYLLAFAGALLLAALVVAVSPLGAIDADITVPFVVMVVGGLAAITWATLR